MAYMVRCYLDICKVGNGMGGAGLYSVQSNMPGYGSGGTPGAAPSTETMRFQQAEQVPGTLDAPTLANLKTAITSAATDLGNQITAAQLAQIQNWATGGE